MPDFIAIDGEGLTRADGSHDYVLLCASDGSYVEQYAPGGLSSGACLEFLLERADANPGAVFVIFGGSYDFQMWLRQAAAPGAQADRNWRALLAERYFTWRGPGRRYKLQAIMRHSFYVANGAYVNGAWRKDRGLKVWDVIGWFQSSFVDAIDHYGVGKPGERDHIRAMKEGRRAFTARQRGAIRAYSLRECDLLVDLMDRVQSALDAQGIRPSRWDGAGAGAAALFRRNKVDEAIARPADPALVDAIDRAYFGGRVQQFVSGVLPGLTHAYDIPGAYPHAMIDLPCLVHGEWRHELVSSAPESAIIRVRWRLPAGARLAPFPFRHEGSIYWPREGEGWYWRREVGEAQQTVAAEIEPLDAWTFRPGCDHRPFAWLADLVNARMSLKIDGDPRERALKLVANAGYGKLVQAQREGRKLPTFQSYIWGGMVTARIRAAVLRFMAAQDRDHLVAVATDGVFTMSPSRRIRDLQDRMTYGVIEPGLLVIQPGVMVGPSARFIRSRGFDRGSVSYRRARNAWLRAGFEASIDVKERRFVSADWAEFTGHRDWWLTWREIPRSLGFATIPRQWPPPGTTDPKPSGLYTLLYPPERPAEGLSAPYHARIREPATEESAYEALCLQQPEVSIEGGIL